MSYTLLRFLIYSSLHMNIIMASNSSLLIAGIDFGTTYSGWAYSFKHEYDSDPTRIWSSQFTGGPDESMKAPTTVLIKPDGKTFHSFGYEAEKKYAVLASEKIPQHENWFYFRRFKMLLYGKVGVKPDIHLEDETQNSLPAITVFSLAIRYLREDMLNAIKDRLEEFQLTEDNIIWVLTVPAICNDASKQFMREAAVEAGIENESLKIALELETASIFCRLLPIEKLENEPGIASFSPGSKYMVLVAGGGILESTVHEAMQGGKIKELHKASGGAWGGIHVDKAYKQFIISLVGNSNFQRFSREYKGDYLEMFRDFEIKKRYIAPERNNTVTLLLPLSLKDIFESETGEEFCNAIKQTKHAKEVSLTGDKLSVDASVMKGLFSYAIRNTVSHVREVLKHIPAHKISDILMVGGFSESKMLQGAIRSSFRKINVIIPQEAGLVVLKGAVVFGQNP